MSKDDAYLRNFCARLKALRQKSEYKTQDAIARELQLPVSTYASYESRFLMPHMLIPLTCELLNCSAWYLLTGQSRATQPPFDREDVHTTLGVYEMLRKSAL